MKHKTHVLPGTVKLVPRPNARFCHLANLIANSKNDCQCCHL